jgi:hypothetical protein
MHKLFDIVRLKQVNNVSFVSGPQNNPASPQGDWKVVGGVGGRQLMLAKDDTIILIPPEDVVIVAEYDLSNLCGDHNGEKEE